MTMLKTNQLSYYYQDGDQRRVILKDINSHFEKGKFYTILGESGSGKTTFLSLISALDSPKHGEVLYLNEDIKNIGYEAYRRNKIGIIFQSYNLIPYMTALENVMLPMAITDNAIPEDPVSVALNLLNGIGITEDKANRTINHLSGGEQQRVAIARALATNVDIILADEPTGNLDEERALDIVEIFKELAHIRQKCVIVVTHSQDVANLSDKTFYLNEGVLKGEK